MTTYACTVCTMVPGFCYTDAGMICTGCHSPAVVVAHKGLTMGVTEPKPVMTEGQRLDVEELERIAKL